MKSNVCASMTKPLDVNPLIRLWHTFSTSKILACAFFEYLKLVKIAMVQVFGSVEDELSWARKQPSLWDFPNQAESKSMFNPKSKS